MQVTLTAKAEQSLREELVRSPGRKPEEVVEEALAVLGRREAALEPSRRAPKVAPEFHAWLRELRRGAKPAPHLSNQTFSREMIYQDHD